MKKQEHKQTNKLLNNKELFVVIGGVSTDSANDNKIRKTKLLQYIVSGIGVVAIVGVCFNSKTMYKQRKQDNNIIEKARVVQDEMRVIDQQVLEFQNSGAWSQFTSDARNGVGNTVAQDFLTKRDLVMQKRQMLLEEWNNIQERRNQRHNSSVDEAIDKLNFENLVDFRGSEASGDVGALFVNNYSLRDMADATCFKK